MRKKDIKGLMHDLGGLEEEFNPLRHISLKEPLVIDLINNNMDKEVDDIIRFYQKKINWFQNRVRRLKGDLKDFKEAKIILFKRTEEIIIVYKNEKYSEKTIFK